MENRLSFDEYGCLLALCAKSRSIDPHTRIGGAAFNFDKRVIGVAYNGLKSGISLPDWMLDDTNRVLKADLMIHCESNLCALLTKDQCSTIFLTQSPCIKCCQNIAALNVSRVVYLKEYAKCDKFKQFLDFHSIIWEQLNKTSKQNILNYIKEQSNFEELNEE